MITKTKLIPSMILLMIIAMTSTAYAQSDWRAECNINNPFDDLICAVDHLESQINIIIDDIVDLVAQDVIHTTDISNLEGNVTSIDSRLGIAETHIQDHHDTVEPLVGILQTNVIDLTTILAELPTISTSAMVDTDSEACEFTEPMPTDWCPNGFLGQFRIFDAAIAETSFVTMSMDNAQGWGLCHVSDINNGNFGITCNFNVPDGAELHYIVLN